MKERETTLTTYLVGPEAEMSGARSEAGTVIEERHEVFTVPPPPSVQIVQDTKIVEHTGPAHHHHHPDPVIINTGPGPREESYERREVYESSGSVGPLALAVRTHDHRKDERAIRAEIKALEAEKEALRAEKRAERELRKADRIRNHGRSSEGDLVLYERERIERPGEEITLVRRERIEEPEGGVRIEKDRKGRMAISVPKYY